MQTQVKFPRKCTDLELDKILAENTNFFIDFPFSQTEKRTLTIVDYQEERLRRKQGVLSNASGQVDEALVQFMEKLAIRTPVLHEALIAAIKNCKHNREPTPLLFLHGNDCQDFDSRINVANYAVRIAVKRLTGQTLVATSPANIWVLPSSEDAYSWIEKKTGFLSHESINELYPRATAVLEHLAKCALEQKGRHAVTEIDDLETLRQIVEVLAVYPHYFGVEEKYRAAFAFVLDKHVAARTIYSRPEGFLHLTSPEYQLEVWNSLS